MPAHQKNPAHSQAYMKADIQTVNIFTTLVFKTHMYSCSEEIRHCLCCELTYSSRVELVNNNLFIIFHFNRISLSYLSEYYAGEQIVYELLSNGRLNFIPKFG